MKKVAFLGLGAMGSRMAKRLLDSGAVSLSVWNRSPDAANAFATLGARVADTPASAASDADVVISMVTDDYAARNVWLAESGGALAAMKAGSIAIESSTVSPEWIQELHASTIVRNIHVIDAPVAGSRPQAEAGQLIFMLGGDERAIESVHDVLAPMASAVHVVGDVGKGATLKLA
ncbi:MAG: NAD(P)-dependent oxidoreductase, partial [Burkholderiales bacterium]